MAKITLYCPEPQGLKLGPGGPGEQIVFERGFAVFDAKDFPDWEAWVKHPTTPYIEVLPADSGFTPDGQHECQVCERKFSTKLALTGHLRSHAPKG